MQTLNMLYTWNRRQYKVQVEFSFHPLQQAYLHPLKNKSGRRTRWIVWKSAIKILQARKEWRCYRDTVMSHTQPSQAGKTVVHWEEKRQLKRTLQGERWIIGQLYQNREHGSLGHGLKSTVRVVFKGSTADAIRRETCRNIEDKSGCGWTR